MVVREPGSVRQRGISHRLYGKGRRMWDAARPTVQTGWGSCWSVDTGLLGTSLEILGRMLVPWYLEHRDLSLFPYPDIGGELGRSARLLRIFTLYLNTSVPSFLMSSSFNVRAFTPRRRIQISRNAVDHLVPVKMPSPCVTI